MSGVAERVLDGLGPAFVERAGPLLAPLVEGLTAELDATDTLLAPTDRGWPLLWDLNLTPYPAWLGQVVGTHVPDGLTPQAQRDYVRDRRAWKRGTPGAIRAAVTAALRGSRRADLLERDTSPWHLTVQVYASEVPSGDTAPLLAAAVSQKPVGIVVDIEVLTGATYAHMTTVHGPTYADFTTAFGSYADARDHIPEA
jgi:hypothetical protein